MNNSDIKRSEALINEAITKLQRTWEARESKGKPDDLDDCLTDLYARHRHKIALKRAEVLIYESTAKLQSVVNDNIANLNF